jgi:deazaflavin-dependent oxidoreductase (nitroreductase family)
MTFTSRNGTRGARQPGGRLMKWINTFNMNRVRSKGGKVMGMNGLVLTTVGRKSGAPRSTPVAWFPDSDQSWLIAASANGAANNPAWYYNLAAHPDQVRIDVASRSIDVAAEQLHGADREQAWREMCRIAPRFAKYKKKTDREIPIIRLRTRSTVSH